MLNLFLAALLTSESAVVSALTHKFVAAVEARDVVALHELIGRETDFSRSDWWSLREVIEKFDHIHVVRQDVTIQREEGSIVTLRLKLKGTAITSGGAKRTIPLPRNWRLELERKGDRWRIRSAMTLEQEVAAAIIAQKSDAARQATLEASGDVDLRTLPNEITALATELDEGADVEAVQFALALSRKNNDAFAEAVSVRRLSSAYVLRHEFAKALPLAHDSLAAARRAQSPDAECAALFTLGIAEWLTNDFTSAVDHLEQAGAMADRIEDPRSAIKAIYMAAYILQGQGHLSAAIPDAQQSERLSEKYGWRTGMVDALLRTGEIHDQLQNTEIYSRLSRRAYEAATKMGDPINAAMALYNEAEAETRLGHFQRAIQSLKGVLGIRFASTGMLRASALDLLGASLSAQHRFADAEKALTESLAVARQMDDRLVAQLALTHLSGLRYAEGRYEEALRYARDAIDITAAGEGATRSVAEFRPWAARTAQGRALEKLDRIDEAIEAFRDAIALLEKSRQASSVSGETLTHYFRGNTYPYLRLIDLQVRRNDIEAALKLSEEIKGRALRDAIEGGRVDLPSLMSPDEKAHERELNRKIADVSRARLVASDAERPKLDEAVQRAQDDLQAFSETLYVARTRTAPTNDSETRPLAVPGGAIILDYVVTEEATIVFAIGRGVTVVKRLPIARDDLVARTKRFTRSLEQRDLRWRKDARRLYDVLLEPVEKYLAMKSVLCIVPDDALWRVPFDALVARDGHPLIDRFAVFYAPSLSFLRLSKQRHPDRGRHSLLAVGNPAGVPGPLPEAEEEVGAISALYPRASVLTGARALETTIKREAGQFDVLHFATHALIDDRSPMFSSLLLTSDAQNDGLLEARELLRLNLHANLAVLSACRTGRGAIYPGEGMVGLSWAFLFAGCPTSVVSRWMVNSRGTADVMIAFHRELTQRDASAAEALRQAELAVRRRPQYQHPYYWAAFHVVGVGW
jgi:CHAT domain-containing protein